MNKEKIHGFLDKIFRGSINELIDYVYKQMEEGKAVQIVTANPEILMEACKDEECERLLNDGRIVATADGISLIKATENLENPIACRITGVDISQYLLEKLNIAGGSLYVLGSSQDTLDLFATKLNNHYRNINIIGLRNGYDTDFRMAMDEICTKRPDVTLVALGVPRQEKLIYRNLDRFSAGIFMGVGGSIDVLSGAKKRAPQFFIRHNLEWLYRIGREPKRLGRFYRNNIKFFRMVKRG